MNDHYHYVQCGLDNVWLTNGFTVEETPYGKGVKIENAEALDKAIAKFLTEKPGRLTGAEVRFLRQMLDMSQKRLGELLGREAQTVALWEKDRGKPVNGDVDFFVRHIYRQTALKFREAYVDMVDHLNAQDRQEYADGIRFKETDEGWDVAA